MKIRITASVALKNTLIHNLTFPVSMGLLFGNSCICSEDKQSGSQKSIPCISLRILWDYDFILFWILGFNKIDGHLKKYDLPYLNGTLLTSQYVPPQSITRILLLIPFSVYRFRNLMKSSFMLSIKLQTTLYYSEYPYLLARGFSVSIRGSKGMNVQAKSGAKGQKQQKFHI